MTDWKFDLDDVGPDADSTTGEDGEKEDPDEELWLPPIEPQRPDLENVIPFLAGIGLALFIFLQVL